MMPNLTRILFAFFAAALIGVTIPGCVPKQEIKPEPVPPPAVAQPVVPPPEPEVLRPVNPQSAVCRSCHAPNAAAGAKDFSAIYDKPKSHHPVGVEYPRSIRLIENKSGESKPGESKSGTNFKQPNGQVAGVAFFDRNGNGLPDNDEVQLFGADGPVMVECASCHSEHGRLPATGKVSAKGYYLRVDNAKSALCEVCHNL
jgi:hypothetical protein